MTAYAPSAPRLSRPWLYDLLAALVLLLAAYFRLTGLLWGEYTFLHPDERFLIWVGADISPVKSLGEYFDTPNSSLNPNNRGHGFYVYGTLPMFLARYAAEWYYGQSGWNEMTQTGRALSSLADLGVVLLVYLTASRAYDRRVGLLAMAFSAGAVLQIQQAHFFTMDTFATFFTLLALYLALIVATQPPGRSLDRAILWPSLGFGVALGMAVASKLNAAPVAAALPVGMLVYLARIRPAERERAVVRLTLYLALAAITSLLIFRIFQPYAFSGPGFFGLKPNPQWVQNITEQRSQASRDVDFPPAMQWARRPLWFSFQNLTVWGLGLPLGLLAWAGFLWMGWRLLTQWNTNRPAWLAHILLWSWTAVYFTWQTLQFNPTMRYQLPIYPTLAIFAAWAVIALFDRGRQAANYGETAASGQSPVGSGRWSLAAVAAGGFVLFATYAYAYAFTQIYTRPVTRVAASRWLFENVPGAVNLPIQTDQGVQNQIIPFGYDQRLLPGNPATLLFAPKAAGTLSQVYLPRVKDSLRADQPITLTLSVASVAAPGVPLASAQRVERLSAGDDPRGRSMVLTLEPPIEVSPAQSYQMSLTIDQPPSTAFNGTVTAYLLPIAGQGEDMVSQVMTPTAPILRPNAPFSLELAPQQDGSLAQIQWNGIASDQEAPRPLSISLSLDAPDNNAETSSSDLIAVPDPQTGVSAYWLNTPIPLLKGELYRLTLRMQPTGGAVSLAGLGIATEGDWDDGLPLRIDGYDPFGGLYPNGLNFNMYWEDSPEKLARFVNILDQADYIVISSNRQWGTLPRIPERFPMTSLYYRALMGCPAEQDVVDCYRVARPGAYHGQLGYDLVQTFVSEPCLGLVCLNDQFAEEAFTVYDHPKVLIFHKTADYDPQRVREILGSVDFEKIIRKPPLHYGSQPATLLLPAERWAEQQAGGTWSALFDSNALVNRYPALGAAAWYLTIFLLGVLAYPILRLALPGLDDRGYPLARSAGMLILSYIVWLAGSARIPFSPAAIGAALLWMAAVSTYLVYRQREQMTAELKARRGYFLAVEALCLALFLAFLFVRFQNPDLWHPWKGGEKPMDFSYFNAVLKSTTFPPYDPWFAGGYLNYYYYGFLLVGTPVKFLGILPAVAYNLILPTLFSLIGLGVFSATWNLSQRAGARRAAFDAPAAAGRVSPYIPALAAVLGGLILGNLGTVRMIYQGFQRLAAPGGVPEDASLAQRWTWGVAGFGKAVGGEKLPYSIGDWYWLPSRAIPAPGDIEPITEFPYFSVLYADLHAHLLALPLTLLALGCLIGLVLGRAKWSDAGGGLAWLGLTALAIGALRPTNTWDMPAYLALGVVAIFYTLLGNFEIPTRLRNRLPWLDDIPARGLRVAAALVGSALLVGLAFLFFQPYAQWYALGYTKVRLWKGVTTPSYSYFIHWGLFLFLLLFWAAWETRDWMAKTPVSALRRLAPYRALLLGLPICLGLLAIGLDLLGAHIAWFVIAFGAWVSLLLLRRDTPDAKRIVLFMVGAGLFLTLMVEVIVLEGDIGRMNTVFKFYLQAWVLFAIAAAVALGWTLPALDDWKPTWGLFWQVGLAALVAGASLYTIMATMAKMDDRISDRTPHTLDGLAYMRYSFYTDEWGTMDLNQDYQAIRWLQEHVQGSPVIVEANLRQLYRWGSRMTINTGLPGVVGWEWHQQQQRAVTPGVWVTERIQEVDNFYTTTNLGEAADFLRKYNVRYIIVGQQEQGHYPGPGLDKFPDAAGSLWREVYRQGDTVIYEVTLPQ